MRSTKVKALSVGGRRKIYYAGDTVSEEMFPKGDFDKLIEKGYLHPVGEGPDDGKNPNFDQDDDQPEARYGSDVKAMPPVMLPGMINPMLMPQPEVQAGPVAPQKPTEPPVVPGTPGHESVKVQNDETGKAASDAVGVIQNQALGQTEGEKKGTLKDQAYLDSQHGQNQDEQIAKIQEVRGRTTEQKIEDATAAEKKAPVASTNFEDVDKVDAAGGITVTQLKKDLDARGIKYPATAKKEDLLKLWARGE